MLAHRSSSPPLLELSARSHRQKFLSQIEYLISSPRAELKTEKKKKRLQVTKISPQAPEWDPRNASPPPDRRERLRRTWSENSHQQSGVQAFYGEHIFTDYSTNVKVERIAGKLNTNF